MKHGQCLKNVPHTFPSKSFNPGIYSFHVGRISLFYFNYPCDRRKEWAYPSEYPYSHLSTDLSHTLLITIICLNTITTDDVKEPDYTPLTDLNNKTRAERWGQKSVSFHWLMSETTAMAFFYFHQKMYVTSTGKNRYWVIRCVFPYHLKQHRLLEHHFSLHSEITKNIHTTARIKISRYKEHFYGCYIC